MAADDEKRKQPAEEAPLAGGLTFLVSTNPHDAQSAADRRRVRQAAALKSWRDMKSEYAGAQPASKRHKPSHTQSSARRLTPAIPLPDRQPIPIRHTSTVGTTSNLPLERWPNPQTIPSTSLVVQGPAPANLKRSHSQFVRSSQVDLPPKLPSQTLNSRIRAHRQGRVRQVPPSDDDYHSVHEEGVSRRKQPLDPCLLLQTHHVQSEYQTKTPCRAYCNDLDPFGCSPVEHKPWHDGILYHMLTVFAPRAWPTLKITNEQGLQWEHFMTQHALAEPALYYVRLLFATGDLIALKVANPQLKLWLQDQAIQAINEALAQPQRATSDALILAIGRIALHESLYGDKVAAHTLHRPAQQRMIALRGGMGSLDFPPLVKRLMRWSDKVMSMQGGTPRMIPDEAEPSYTDTTSVDVLEKWAPSEGKALRKKVQALDSDPPRE